MASFLKILIGKIFTILFLISSVCVAAQSKVDSNFHLYLLIGQSNMAGRGNLDEQSKKINPKIMMLERKIVINKVINQLPQSVTNTAVVSASGLTDKGDRLHFDTPSSRKLGKRYADAFIQLQNTKPTSNKDTIAYGQINLWLKGYPNTNGIDHLRPNDKEQNFKPSIRVFLPPKDKATGRAVVAYPGGGYSHLAMSHEGYDMATFFVKQGIALIVLKYRMPLGKKEVVLSDAEEAIRITKENAKNWNINPNDIGIMGSSAGGHLASTIATHFKPDLKPAFQILLYPVITMDSAFTHRGSRRSFLGENPTPELVRFYSNELQVAKETPRAFIALSDDDKVVQPVNSIKYYLGLQKNNVPASLHIYPSGKHGWGAKESFQYHDLFLNELKAWLKSF